MHIVIKTFKKKKKRYWAIATRCIFGPVCRLSLGNIESNLVADFIPGFLLFCPSLCVSISVLELPSSGLCMRMECGSIVQS